MYLKLLKRCVQQQFIFLLMIAASKDITSYVDSDNMQNDQLSETQLTELRNHLQPYENDANKAAALQQTKGILVEKNMGSTFIAHKFFPGISCATDLLAEIRMKLTSEHGEYYIHQLRETRPLFFVVV